MSVAADLQKAFSLIRQLQGALGGKSISEQRSIAGTMAAGAGASLHPLDVTDVPNAEGVIGVQITPASHNTFSFYVHRNPAVGLVFNNTGAAQGFTATYYVIG